METKDLKKKKEGDLHQILAETRDKLRDLRFKDANKQLKNIREIREGKKTVARILTLLNLKKNSSTPEVKEETKEEKK
ncbi:50S ribosomal protein L29 [Candidatus Parcubacteria bacterium]|nr:MAG: 50S ribosomal protein L29 [Candidatus Parcubacteria bacterium]